MNRRQVLNTDSEVFPVHRRRALVMLESYWVQVREHSHTLGINHWKIKIQCLSNVV